MCDKVSNFEHSYCHEKTEEHLSIIIIAVLLAVIIGVLLGVLIYSKEKYSPLL